MKNIPAKYIEKAWTYEVYWNQINTLFDEGKTTGENQSEALLDYTKLNIARMRRLDKTTRLTEASKAALEKNNQKVIWLVITEAWCGDAAQIIPVLNKLAEASDNIQMKLVLRDENPDLMDSFLTNGTRSIPILIVVDETNMEVLASWGPRPEEVQSMIMTAKKVANAKPEESTEIWYEAKKDAQLWYAKDKTKTIQAEVLKLV